MLTKSIVLSALVPQTESNFDVFQEAVSWCADKAIGMIEFYSPSFKPDDIKKTFEKHHIRSTFLGALEEKRLGFNLCSLVESERMEAVRHAKNCLKYALSCGSSALLLTSGKNPTGSQDRLLAEECLIKSLYEILECCPSDFQIKLEPGDIDVDAKQLIGPTVDAISIAEAVRKKYSNFFLLMDTSHLAQLGENIIESIDSTISVCNQIHLADCILKPNHLLFGDKHPNFSNPDNKIGVNSIKDIAYKAIQSFGQKDLALSLEVISRNQDRLGVLDLCYNDVPWFFNEL